VIVAPADDAPLPSIRLAVRVSARCLRPFSILTDFMRRPHARQRLAASRNEMLQFLRVEFNLYSLHCTENFVDSQQFKHL